MGMSREAAVRAGVEAAFGVHTSYHYRVVEAILDAAAPHLTADLVRERNEACRDAQEWMRRAEKAEAAIARVEALHPNNGGWCNRCRTQHPCSTVAAMRE